MSKKPGSGTTVAKKQDTTRIDVTVPGARTRFEAWIKDRGGVQVWNNVNLSDCGAGLLFTPALTDSTTPEQTPKPHWSRERGEVVKDISRFRFLKAFKEVKRIKIAVRVGSQGLSLKLTDASSAKVRKWCEKIAEGNNGVQPYYHFECDECVLELPEWDE